jgi:hypothetical protein
LLAHGRWFSTGTPTSSITKTGRHDIAEILLKVALDTINLYIQAEEPLKEGQVDFKLLYIQAEELLKEGQVDFRLLYIQAEEP